MEVSWSDDISIRRERGDLRARQDCSCGFLRG